MNVTQKEMDEINRVQLNMFKEFINVCEQLNLRYFAIHGTLLGALKYKGFFPYDDDIDVAMPRKDYEIFISQGQKLLSKNLFIQCNKTESDYPLVFAKLRDSDTAFIQPNLNNFDINKGIYIDIFPIDNFPNNKKQQKLIKMKKIIYMLRVSSRFCNTQRTLKQKIALFISRMVCHNWNLAMEKLEKIYTNVEENENCIVYGGKNKEIEIPYNLFSNGEELEFEKIKIKVPSKYKEYLKIIYEDYDNYFPAKEYMVSDDLVEISAEIVDTNKSYKNYIKIKN